MCPKDGSDSFGFTQCFKAKLLLPLILEFSIEPKTQDVTGTDKSEIPMVVKEENYGCGQSLLSVDCSP